MNANELADELDAMLKAIGLTDNRVPTMLRQQQAEIESLKLQLHTTLTNRDLRTYDGKLDMNNEPVAWMLTDRVVSSVPIEGAIPLYTHPAKTTLSRMEVYELAIDSGFMLSTQYGQAENKLMPVSDGDTLVKLVRAILKKAQEK